MNESMINYGVPWQDDDVSDELPIGYYEDRFRHLYLLGKTRTGKTTFFLNLIKQELDHAVIVLDPTASFAPYVAGMVPKDRLVYINKNHPIVINPLRREEYTWDIAANEFIEVMNACVTSSTSTMESTVLMAEILRNAIRVLNGDQKSIEYLSQYLNFEKIRKDHFIDDNDPYWQFFDSTDRRGWKENREKVESAKRVGARLSAFWDNPLMKSFTVGHDQFDVSEIVKDKKIVCFDLHGLDSQSIVYLGNLVTHAVKSYYLHQATEHSQPLFLYVDEFHLFVSQFFDSMLSQCGKYNISVNLAHQDHLQIKPTTLSAVLGNCHTYAVFSCGYAEAARMAKEYQLDPSDFLNLDRFECYLKTPRGIHKILTFPPPKVELFEPDDKFIAEASEEYNTNEVNFLRDCWFSC
jgi:type IV secretory pathway VirB4 component